MSELVDSGIRKNFDTGAEREIIEGKGRCDLLPENIGKIIDYIKYNTKEIDSDYISKILFILLFLETNIFIADDLALNGKFTNLFAVVKSSKIITGRLFSNTPSVSFVYPKIKVFPAVKTGVSKSSL